MGIRWATKLSPLVAGWGATGSGLAQMGALAQEFWSQNFCEQAVSITERRGESPEALDRVDCRPPNLYQPSCWRCAIEAMQADSTLMLDAARETCLADY
jgi:hypothetical protein